MRTPLITLLFVGLSPLNLYAAHNLCGFSLSLREFHRQMQEQSPAERCAVEFWRFNNESIGTFPMTFKGSEIYVLLTVRQDKKQPKGKNLSWDWIGGTIEAFEEPLATFDRELDEEMGPEASNILNTKKSAFDPHLSFVNPSRGTRIWKVLKVVSEKDADRIVALANAFVKARYLENPNPPKNVSYPVFFEWVPLSFLDQIAQKAQESTKREGKFIENLKIAASQTLYTSQTDGKSYPARFFLSALSLNPAFPTWFDEARAGARVPAEFSADLQ